MLWILSPPLQLKNKITASLKSYEYQIESHFESLRRHWVTWSWPINKGRGEIDDGTDVPPVSGEYELSMDDDNNPCSIYFHGKVEKDEIDIISRRTKKTTFLLWQTFINTMKLLKLLQENVSVRYILEYSFIKWFPLTFAFIFLSSRNLQMKNILKHHL